MATDLRKCCFRRVFRGVFFPYRESQSGRPKTTKAQWLTGFGSQRLAFHPCAVQSQKNEDKATGVLFYPRRAFRHGAPIALPVRTRPELSDSLPGRDTVVNQRVTSGCGQYGI